MIAAEWQDCGATAQPWQTGRLTRKEEKQQTEKEKKREGKRNETRDNS